jgi:hypothetical protein
LFVQHVLGDHEECLRSPNTLDNVWGEFEVDFHLPLHGVKPSVAFQAERHSEPSEMMLPANVVHLDRAEFSADRTLRDF